jgi:cystathionine gamma-synthase
MYNGLRERVHRFLNRWGLAFSEFDPTAPNALEAAIRPAETKLVLIETPCNPTWDVTDIAAAALAHSVGEKLAIDSTVATPLLTRPIEVGADYVMHSATKYLNGQSDVVAGALAAAAVDELWVKTRESRSLGGAILGPFEAWLVLRGTRTMHLRVQQFCASAMYIASQFSAYPKIERVLYPGLADHPGHEITNVKCGADTAGRCRIRSPAAATQRYVWPRPSGSLSRRRRKLAGTSCNR